MKRVALGLLLSVTAPLMAAGPTQILAGPFCDATKAWDQDEVMNKYTGGAFCGCDPLAWGQIATFHALNHGVPSATFHPPKVSGTVILPDDTEKERASLRTDPYDWVAVRDRTMVKLTDGTEERPVARLMYDFGIIGGARYANDMTLATVNEDRFREYFEFQDGYRYPVLRNNGATLPEWKDMLHRMLRVSLQVGAPLCGAIYVGVSSAPGGGHMIVIDGWGIDDDGTEHYHVNYGWGGTQGNTWWDWERASFDPFSDINVPDKGFRTLYPNVYPTNLGSIVVGRVADDAHQAIANATITLTDKNGTRWTTATDAKGCYTFTHLPLVPIWQDAEQKTPYAPDALPKDTYTVTVAAPGYTEQTATVEIGAYIDEDIQKTLQGANGDKDFYPTSYGGSVADFTLEADVTIVTSPNGLKNLPAGKTVYVATGTYTLTAPLTIPAGTTLIGGYNPTTGAIDPLATPTRLDTSKISSGGDFAIELKRDATLDGFALVGNTKTTCVAGAADGVSGAAVRNCILISHPTWGMSGISNVVRNVALSTCVVFDITGARFAGCTATHCTFLGDLPIECNDKGGNLFSANRTRAQEPNPCTADHECPERGLDGRPLNKQMGALAPDCFDHAPAAAKNLGYRLLLK